MPSASPGSSGKLQQVAARAGVSTSTVSRVLSRPDLVNASTRALVERVIRELQYKPSRVARRLRAERTSSGLIGLLIPDIQNPFFADVVRGVEDVAQDHGHSLFIGNSDEDVQKERQYLDLLRSESVDGIVLPPCEENDKAAHALIRDGVPVVCIDRRLTGITVDTVVLNNVAAADQATEHLLRAGHRRIGFIEGRPQISTSEERLEGYAKALARHRIRTPRTLVRAGDSRQASGRALAGELLDLDPAPTALIAGNNLMTVGALEAIRERGLRIPHDVALVGFDDIPWMAVHEPPLTVVRQPAYEMGRRAMELLIQRIADPARTPSTVVLSAELVVRASSVRS